MYLDSLLVYNPFSVQFMFLLLSQNICARLELRYIMGISRRKIIIGKKKSSTMYTFSYFRKMASISPFFLCSSKRLSKWSSLTFGFAWLNFQGPNKPFKHKLKFPLEPWGQTLNYVAIDFHFYIFMPTMWKNILPNLKNMVFCLQNCSDLLWEKISSDRGFANFLRLLEQFIQTVKGQANFETECFFNLFLEVSQT